MRSLLLLVMATIALSLPLFAGCDEGDIDTVLDNGRIIVLTDGSAWVSSDPATSSTWLAADTVLLCNDAVMINKDENGERIDVSRTSYDPDDDNPEMILFSCDLIRIDRSQNGIPFDGNQGVRCS